MKITVKNLKAALGLTALLFGASKITSCNLNVPSTDSKKPQTQDMEITASDLGDWSWESRVIIEASKFSNLVSGDYITFTTEKSETATDYFQLQFSSNDIYLGKNDKLTNSTYSEEYNTINLLSSSQKTIWYPNDSEIELLKKYGLLIKGYGVKLTKVTARINANYDKSNPALSSTLCDLYATDNAKHLYNYLIDIYGSKVITGQMENAWNSECNMLNRVYNDTGKYPALMGFDFMNYTSMGYNSTKVEVERAINFWNGKDYNGNKISDNHGIVAFMWHWRDPMASSGKTGSFTPGDGSLDENGNYTSTSFRIPYDTKTKTWKTSSNEYKAIIEDFDIVSAELAKLQKAGVPVIWRPMHEAAGNLEGGWKGASSWFWWGAGNQTGITSEDVDLCGECYIALWRLMYEYFTETKGLHNLIWLWNGQHIKFYPGSNYVDIIGDDIYETFSSTAAYNHVYNSNKTKFDTYQKWDPKKLVALSECGNLPDVSKDGALWSFFMVWNDGATDSSGKVTKETNSNNFWSGTFFNTEEKKKEIYVTNETTITLDELPDLTKY